MDSINTDDLDRTSMGQLVDGNDEALNDLMQRHSTPIFHYLYRMLGHEGDAQDIAQEVFVRVYQNRQRFDRTQRFTTWLYTIATNLARNHHRWQTRHPQVSMDQPQDTTGATLGEQLPAATNSPLEQAEQTERMAAVRDAVDHLPNDMREAMVLCQWEEMPVAEAAQVLKTTTKSVESRLYRARQILRERLKHWL